MTKPKKGRLASEVLKDPEIARMLDYSHRRPEFLEGGNSKKKDSLLSDPATSIDDIK
jgi:hypothetical protein